ncbi:type I-E CRISPR-associated protein Cse2/CasB [Xenorhabdus nematophila]|uniref:type I-E CRISPR-associated protein Cse2/CasB n=2 Tax=Xenorhabdus nematophila TaxID=628 RepID=UPI0005445551|nr:type I-E CRISPR-associated protein Cse2/CasB [Xenorhabdus nematophila]CEF28684.1 CRISPR-associated protein, Cse2 family [Xenorhabdus nematophila str. Websteri]AYA39097.1 type I-E CRISPR-associated protein Cse2/CasB [Xenorhabdus nematophila]AYA42375.1 type I-E CRISPR-associated protein Cse2/CasB [Xenorhabdus nematophila]MBA0021109.1 type I-E CRISPR-associated protein Cse2/CasB [Xenorhabdus nematophila]MCB4425219.1 type I-E CRISPR-associated protein Cse2/CasB [Xenorhabdus nematophila]
MNSLFESCVIPWWESMFLTQDELKKKKIRPAPTLYKAQLKRCQDIDSATWADGFRALWFSLPENVTEKAEQKNITLWAMIAVSLVYVKTNTTTNLATAAGTKTENDKPIVSAHRFAQLQAARTPDEFIMRLRRVLQQLDGKVSVLSLANDIHQWMKEYHQSRPNRANKRLCVQWAMDYYKAAK